MTARSPATGAPALAAVSPPESLYVHFPFCVHRCHYCDFSVHRTGTPPVDEWLDCLEREIDWWMESAGWSGRLQLETLFVGGGTPSLIGDKMDRLGTVLRGGFDLESADLEWTAESNPASLDPVVLEAWLLAGVNRLSVGVQSFEDEALSWLGRLHDSAGAREAITAARAAGFEDVNADLIFGLPPEIERDWAAEVESVLEAGVTHVSTYGLTAEPGTPLGRRVRSGDVRMAGGDQYASEYLAAVGALVEAGFVHYEVSNFALPGHECVHNWHYWDGTPYLGLGPSAHGFVGDTRVWNVYRWEAYRRALAGGDGPLEGHETVGAGESRLERLWLALRTNRGLVAGDPLVERVLSGAGDLIEAWHEAGWVTPDDGCLRLSAEGWLRLDELVAALGSRMPPPENGSGRREG